MPARCFRYAEAQEAANSVLQFDNLNADAIYVRGLCLYYEVSVEKFFIMQMDSVIGITQ
jgi:hypothetical protein